MDPQQQHDITILTIFMGGIKHQIMWSVFSIASIESHMGIYIYNIWYVFPIIRWLYEYGIYPHMTYAFFDFFLLKQPVVFHTARDPRKSRNSPGRVSGGDETNAGNPTQNRHIYICIYIYTYVYIYVYIYISISIKQPLYDYGWMGLFLNVQASIVILTSTHTHTLKTHSLQFKKQCLEGI